MLFKGSNIVAVCIYLGMLVLPRGLGVGGSARRALAAGGETRQGHVIGLARTGSDVRFGYSMVERPTESSRRERNGKDTST